MAKAKLTFAQRQEIRRKHDYRLQLLEEARQIKAEAGAKARERVRIANNYTAKRISSDFGVALRTIQDVLYGKSPARARKVIDRR